MKKVNVERNKFMATGIISFDQIRHIELLPLFIYTALRLPFRYQQARLQQFLVSLHEVTAATVPNFTVLVPCVAPNFVPVIVTGVPAVPLVGLIEVMVGNVPPMVK